MILPEGLQAFDNFGAALAYADGLLAVGAPNTDGEDARNMGAVYLFQKKGDTWQQVARLTPDPPQPDSRFGSTLALDGEVLAVGAPYEYNPGAGNASGAVYVFGRSKSQWVQEARLAASDGAPFDLFGGALALQGRNFAVGARAADGPNGQRDAGAVYVYRQDRPGWALQARLGAESAPFDHFGHALAFAGDDLLVGAPDSDVAQTANAGLVYVYRFTQGSWRETSQLHASEARPQARFGAALNVQGGRLAVVAPQEYPKPGPVPPNAFAYQAGWGAAHLFERQGGQWQWRARLVPEPADEQHTILVSSALITTSGGRTRLTLAGFGRGSLYPFEQQGGTWQALPALDLPDPTLIEGQALAAADGQILLGVRFYDVQKPGREALQSAGVVWIVDW
jgi:ketosteroid isomerase-like protein